MISRTQSQSTSSASDAHERCVILEARGLKKTFGGQIVLDGVNLDLRRGEVVLLRGENGSGKTTLLNILTGNLEPDAGSIHYLADGTPRMYRFPRRWWQQLNPFDHFTPEFVAQEGMGRTWQDIRLFGSQSLRENISVAEPRHPGENPLLALFRPYLSAQCEAEAGRKADAMLDRLGLITRGSSSADKISLGQSKRVAIARAVAGGAHILFLDEPLAGLDRTGISKVLDLLRSLVRETNLTLVIVEHVFNQHHLSDLVTTDWLLDAGTLRHNGRSSNQGRVRISPTQPAPRPVWFEQLGNRADIVDDALPRGAVFTRVRRGGLLQNTMKPALEICGLIVKRGTRTVIGLDDTGGVSGLDLVVYAGEIAFLQAPNGWGKSTLLAAICGLLPIAQGQIRLHGRRLDQLPIWERVRAGLSVLPSERNSFPNLLGREALRLVGHREVDRKLQPLLDRHCSSLSGGEKQKLALAAMREGSFSVYDEPLAAMDTAEPFVRRLLSDTDPDHASLVLMPSSTI